MKLFKKSTLGLALTAAMTGGTMMGVSTPVQAVDIAHDGLGQALVFPYYSTRDGWNTYFNLTNTADLTVAVKVRWREGVNSRDVRDFNVILSPYDVWTAATVNDTDGARMVTSDNTCTVPQLPAVGAAGLNGIGFTNTAYTLKGANDNRDKGPTTLDRTREGYFEVIEMGVIDRANPISGTSSSIAAGARHIQNGGNNAGIPANCANVNSLFANNLTLVQNAFDAPRNVLKGRAVLINAASGVAAGYDPLVLKDFSDVALINAPATERPSLADATPLDPQMNLVTDSFGNGQDGVAAVENLILRTALINDYNVASGSETDWVLTFPTKGFRVDVGFAASANFAGLPFGTASAPQYPFINTAAPNAERFSQSQNGKSCFDVTANIYDREEFITVGQNLNDFSPAEPGAAGNKLCYEANILSFGESNLFNSELRKSLTNLPALNGWASVGFGGAPLPVIGMRVEKRNKGDATVNYGFANDHAYKVPPMQTPL